uniref:Inositol oxygenase n=1 Tax=Buteo japonicus TaxID=224669 RepID=A0A8C0BDM1_9AVES
PADRARPFSLQDADPSEEPKSGKAKSEYRNYTVSPAGQVLLPLGQSAEYGTCSLRKMSAMEALELLDQLVDESDPDVDFPNSYHAYQTAEGIRRAHPDKDWFHLVGLLHDLGKVLALFGEPQWAVVGDTFPVGCKVQRSVVFGDSTFHNNPDTRDPLYSTEYGMYQPHCGLENVLMSWGHDGKGWGGPPPRPHTDPPSLLQQVRPLHQAGGAARRAAAPGLLPVPDRQVLPRAALLVSGDPHPPSPSTPDLTPAPQHRPWGSSQLAVGSTGTIQ